MIQRTVVSQAPRAVRSIRSTDTSAPRRKATTVPSITIQISSRRIDSSVQVLGCDSTKRATTCHMPRAEMVASSPQASVQARLVSQRSRVRMVWRMGGLHPRARCGRGRQGTTGRIT